MEHEKKIKLKKKQITIILYKVLMVITAIVMIVSIVLFFMHEDGGLDKIINQVLLCAGAMICLSIPIFLEKKFKMFIPNYIVIMLFLFVFAHFILGEIYRVYDYSILFDKILHTTSGIIIAMLSYSIVSILNELPKNKTKLSPFFLSLFAFCFTMTIEYLWELLEYLIDTLTNSNMQRWQDSLYDKSVIPNVNKSGEYTHTNARGNGLNDTMIDMLVNIFGALAVSIYGYIGMKLKPESWILDKVILTDGDISAMKETTPQIEVNREKPKAQKRFDIPLKHINKLQKRYLITAQKAKKVYLKENISQRNILLENKKNEQKKRKHKDSGGRFPQ